MIIRSQDKRTICNFRNVINIYISSQYHVYKKEIVAQYENSYDELGTYSTEEKAVEVLDEIQHAYLVYSCLHRNEWKGGGNIDDCKSVYIFEMPQDDESEEE